MKDKPAINISVLGGGHGGLAEAAYLSLSGHKVTLFNRTLENILAVKQGVELSGGLNDTAYISNVTDDLKFAVEHAEVIFIVLPAYAHKDILCKMREYLIDGQILVLMPGKLGGGLEALHILKEWDKNITIFETESVIVGARRLGTNHVYIHGVKHSVKIGGVNILQDRAILVEDFKLLKTIHSEFMLVNNIMEASFSEVGCVLHPVINLLNTARIESGHKFLFYVEGATSSVSKVIEALDLERIRVAYAYGISVESASETTRRYYQSSGENIITVLRNTITYKDVASPANINNRFFGEDVLVSLGLYKILARLAGVDVPVVDSIVALTKCICATDTQISRDLTSFGYEGYEYLQLKEAVTSLAMQT